MNLTQNSPKPQVKAESEHRVIVVDRTQEVRCPQCNKLAFKGRLGSGTEIEIRCTRCYGVDRKHYFFRVRVM